MNIGIFTTCGNTKYTPDSRQDAWREAIASYEDLADEVVIVSGNKDFEYNKGKTRTIYLEWPYSWNWLELPLHMNKGLEELETDMVLRMDLDYILHEDNISNIKNKLNDMQQYPVLNMQKFVFITGDRYYQKGASAIIINKGLVGDKYKFGQPTNCDNDLCFPIRVTGINDKGIPEGLYEPETHGKTGLPFYVYDATFKTKEIVKQEYWRFAQAYKRYFGEWRFGATKKDSFKRFLNMMRGRLERCVYRIGDKNSIRKHPKYIENRIRKVTKDEFYFNGWGLL